MRIPSPRELGFPEKYDGGWRPAQQEALTLILRSQKRVKALAMPTGSGKTGVVVAWALITRQPTAIVTENIGLMDQYLEDFRGVGMVSLMGRSRYDCGLKPDYSCEDGIAARCPHHGSVTCPLSAAIFAAAGSSLVVTNYDKWTSARMFGQGMEHYTQVAFDEGHEAPGKLASAMQVIVSAREVHDTLEMDYPRQKDEMVDWKGWAQVARAEAETRMIALKGSLTGPNVKASWVKEYVHLRNLSRRLNTLATCKPEYWVVDEIEKGFQFDPVRVGRYSESTLLLKLPNILVVSATLRPKTMFMIGVGKEAMEFKEFDSDFKKERCPIYYVPTMRVDKNARDLKPLWILHDQIAARRQDRRGLVHTISYARRDDIVNQSRFGPRMMVNPKGEPTTDTIEMFFKAPREGSILVSPSIGQGFDFAYERAEWQFIVKIPFPDSRSKIVQARQEDDKEWGPLHACYKLAQIAGRLMRAWDDQGETFIGDAHLDWFLKRWGYLFPRTFNQFFKRVSLVPPPPPRL